MNIQLYDTLTKTKKEFKPLDNEVKMYVCGVTPYDTSHLGHAFVFTFFDALIRFLKFNKYKVHYVQNVTDIDDPLIQKAKELDVKWEDLADKWINYLLEDFAFLNIEMPTFYVKATNELDKMIEIVKILIEKDFAYIKDGSVYFDISKFPKYGELSRYTNEEMIKISSERGNDINDKNKRNPLDFLLWKKSLPDEPMWDSPWSKGRPGWHIECTAMSNRYLGNRLDIHGGGADLIFPHHESEIAQAESFSGEKPFVNFWMHCAMVFHENEKMSKSIGNLVWIKDLAKKYSANAIRYYILSHPYRTEWEFCDDEMKDAANEIERLSNIIKTASKNEVNDDFINHLADDMNTKEAFKIMSATKNPNELKQMFEILGFK